MEKSSYAIPDVKDGPQFSKLESTLVSANPAPRPISKDGQHVFRHHNNEDVIVNELDFNFDVRPDEWPLANIESVQDLFSGVVYREHISKEENFSAETAIECLQANGDGSEWLSLNHFKLEDVLDGARGRALQTSTTTMPPKSGMGTTTRKMLIFFVPLIPAPSGSSYQYKLPMTRSSTDLLFTSLHLNPGFLPNLLGRPDYWAPQPRWDAEDGNFLSCDFFCQLPRWNLQSQGAPLSVYSKYDAQEDLILYVISHKQGDTVVNSLCKLLRPLIEHQAQCHISHILQESPFDIYAMICNLNFEASKWHVKRFQRFQWNTVNGVDDFLAGKDQGNRKKLASMLKDLQIVAQNADSHLANAQVFLHSARGICDIARRLNVSKRGRTKQRTLDMLRYLIDSMEKQHMWFANYKGRKENVMNLVFHFNTQTDALNNIELAADMKKDSTSMNAIAGLTMIFLPGTFTAVSPLSISTFPPTEPNSANNHRSPYSVPESSNPPLVNRRFKQPAFGGCG
ncbi:hypothetical protein SLS60_008810 [Paraconiothyrium brasiliense]|uniref:Uncharacterized protein n=1 Tax=Paraconiothyrium brasiliense TaxID=300254 RepID=A0ABR3QYW3_9PLEO